MMLYRPWTLGSRNLGLTGVSALAKRDDPRRRIFDQNIFSSYGPTVIALFGRRHCVSQLQLQVPPEPLASFYRDRGGSWRRPKQVHKKEGLGCKRSKTAQPLSIRVEPGVEPFLVASRRLLLRHARCRPDQTCAEGRLQLQAGFVHTLRVLPQSQVSPLSQARSREQVQVVLRHIFGRPQRQSSPAAQY